MTRRFDDPSFDKSESLSRNITSDGNKWFVELCRECTDGEGPIWELLRQLGFREELDLEAISFVRKFVADEIKAELRSVAASYGIGEWNASDVLFDEFTDVVGGAFRNISESLLVDGTMQIDILASLIEDRDVSGVDQIAKELVEAVFMEATNIVTSRSLDEASFTEIRCLFEAVMSLKSNPEVIEVDRGLLETKTKKLWEPLIECFHEEYSARLDSARPKSGNRFPLSGLTSTF
jgi:hypothetical protein